jgi:hypothetical protein
MIVDTTNTQGRSWSFMLIIDDKPRAPQPIAVLFWAILDVFRLWCEKYVRRGEASN